MNWKDYFTRERDSVDAAQWIGYSIIVIVILEFLMLYFLVRK